MSRSASPPGPVGGSPHPAHDGLLVLWLALLSADRIDLSGGAAPFVLTPFLALTPVVLASELLRATSRRGERMAWTRSGTIYALLCSALLSLAILSVLLGLPSELAGRRTVLLTFLVTSTLAVAATMLRRPGADRVLVAGAKTGLILAVVFSVWQLAYWLSGRSEPVSLAFATVNLSTPPYQGWIPRLSGQVADMNRAGLLYVAYLFVLWRWERPGATRPVWIVVAVGLILLTLSRSALLALGVVGLVELLERSEVRISRPALALSTAVAATLFAWALLDPGGRESLGRTLRPLSARFSLAEGSARSHFELLGRGVREAAASPKRALVGVGYGNSHLILEDVFPGNPYGNFHSIYVTFLAESGVLAFVVIVVLIGYPVIRGGPVRALVAGAAAYNVFYQASAEPLMWFLLAWAWLTLPSPLGPPDDGSRPVGATSSSAPG